MEIEEVCNKTKTICLTQVNMYIIWHPLYSKWSILKSVVVFHQWTGVRLQLHIPPYRIFQPPLAAKPSQYSLSRIFSRVLNIKLLRKINFVMIVRQFLQVGVWGFSGDRGASGLWRTVVPFLLKSSMSTTSAESSAPPPPAASSASAATAAPATTPLPPQQLERNMLRNPCRNSRLHRKYA